MHPIDLVQYFLGRRWLGDLKLAFLSLIKPFWRSQWTSTRRRRCSAKGHNSNSTKTGVRRWKKWVPGLLGQASRFCYWQEHQYIIRKAFDCSPDGKVCDPSPRYVVSLETWQRCDCLSALPPWFYPLASERTVLRRCRILMDRRVSNWPQSISSIISHRSHIIIPG